MLEKGYVTDLVFEDMAPATCSTPAWFALTEARTRWVRKARTSRACCALTALATHCCSSPRAQGIYKAREADSGTFLKT